MFGCLFAHPDLVGYTVASMLVSRQQSPEQYATRWRDQGIASIGSGCVWGLLAHEMTWQEAHYEHGHLE
jgi:hypothetical protein